MEYFLGVLMSWPQKMTPKGDSEAAVSRHKGLSPLSMDVCSTIIKYYLLLQWSLAKKMFADRFNSYVEGTERETKNLQSESLTLAHAAW